MKCLLTAVVVLCSLSGCASITNDAYVPIAFSMSDGSDAECVMTNKRGQWPVEAPDTVMIRRSDDALRYNCETEDGRKAVGAIDSTIGAKIVASAVFIDFGITDAITDKHREYPASYVIPIKKSKAAASTTRTTPEEVLSIADSMMCSDNATFLRSDGDRDYWKIDCNDGESLEVLCVQGTCYAR